MGDKSKYTLAHITRRSKRLQYYGRSYLTQELKFKDTATTDSVVSATGFINPSLVLIAQGLDECDRIGRHITVKSLSWRFEVTMPETTGFGLTACTDVVRLIVYCDKQSNGTNATVTDILETAGLNEFNNLANRGRFRILSNRFYTVQSKVSAGDGTANDVGGTQIHGSVNLKMKLRIEYDLTTAAIEAITSANLGMLFISKHGIAGVIGICRVRFEDS